MQQTSFANNIKPPLSEQLRPNEFEDVFGQEHLFGKNGIISRMIDNNNLQSLILWGPPGCGKTTLAKIIAHKSKLSFKILSAVSSKVKDLKEIFDQTHQKTLLIIDEIHHFNRTQQDVFLPYIEEGRIVLIGATTENPSFALNNALLSRCKVITLKSLKSEALYQIIKRAEKYYNKSLNLDHDAKEYLINLADGDGRYLINLLEEIFNNENINTKSELAEFLQKRAPLYDNQEMHYNLISALHKSLRGSDSDASLYWLARMLEGGEEPLYILRRLVRVASEDIGLADPNALSMVIAAKNTYEFLGSPEGELAIAQAVIYLAVAPKSNACYLAYNLARMDANQTGSLMPPKHILNAPTKLMKMEGYGENYIYDHDLESGISGQNFFPDELEDKNYYKPKERGFEREILKRIKYFNSIKYNN